jgi:hypothetical protein
MPGVPCAQVQLGSRPHVVAEARSWKGTPYELGQRLKKGGVDCGLFLSEVLVLCGLVTREQMDELLREVGFYGHDWFCHESSDPGRYLRMMLRHAEKIMEGVAYPSTQAHPGNLVLAKVRQDRYFNHGGIITRWPWVMHCVEGTGVNEVNITTDPLWSFRPIAIFDPFKKPLRGDVPS